MSDAERSSSAAELTAPHETTTVGAGDALDAAAALDLDGFDAASRRIGDQPRARSALVHSVTFGCAVAGRTRETSASLFAWMRQANELQVLHSTQPSGSPGLISPSGSGDGCSPCARSRVDDARHAGGVRHRRDTDTVRAAARSDRRRPRRAPDTAARRDRSTARACRSRSATPATRRPRARRAWKSSRRSR